MVHAHTEQPGADNGQTILIESYRDKLERLADFINREPVEERDRFFIAMLKPFGIEKGERFKPTGRQKKILAEAILAEATLVGETMAKANDFAKPMEESYYVDGGCRDGQRDW